MILCQTPPSSSVSHRVLMFCYLLCRPYLSIVLIDILPAILLLFTLHPSSLPGLNVSLLAYWFLFHERKLLLVSHTSPLSTRVYILYCVFLCIFRHTHLTPLSLLTQWNLYVCAEVSDPTPKKYHIYKRERVITPPKAPEPDETGRYAFWERREAVRAHCRDVVKPYQCNQLGSVQYAVKTHF